MITQKELLPDFNISNSIDSNNWKIKRLRFCLRDGYFGLKIGPFGSQIKLVEMDREGGEYKIFGQENIIANDFKKGSRFISEKKFKELQVYEIDSGDILITMMGTTGECLIAPIDIQNGIMDSHLIRLRTKEELILPEYLQLLISSAKYIDFQVQVLGKGSIMLGLNSTIIKSLNLIIPTISYQHQVLKWMEIKIGMIDNLIKQKVELLKLLAEKRTAIINQAVTKGLDPTTELKNSEIVWMGEIPKEWEIKKIKYLSSKVGDGLHGTPEYTDETEFYFINGNNLGNGVIQITPQTRTISEEQFLANDLDLTPKTILLSINGTIGNVSFYKGEKVMLGKSAAYIKFFNWIDIEFIRWYLESSAFKNYCEVELTGTTIKNLSLESIKNAPITFPNKSVQKEIVYYLDKRVEELDKIKSSIEKSILKLKEYREGLITSAVTGQIDVRKEVRIG